MLKVLNDLEDIFNSSNSMVVNFFETNRKYKTSDFDEDWEKEDDGLSKEINLAGVEKENINITCSSENVLSIKAKRYKDKEVIKDYDFSYHLPEKADKDSIDVSYVNGILKISIKFKKDEMDKKIEIK